MKTLRKFFKWWANHTEPNYDVMLPTGMIPYRFIEMNYVKKDNK